MECRDDEPRAVPFRYHDALDLDAFRARFPCRERAHQEARECEGAISNGERFFPAVIEHRTWGVIAQRPGAPAGRWVSWGEIIMADIEKAAS